MLEIREARGRFSVARGLDHDEFESVASQSHVRRRLPPTRSPTS
jgi:hypothetical protein